MLWPVQELTSPIALLGPLHPPLHWHLLYLKLQLFQCATQLLLFLQVVVATFPVVADALRLGAALVPPAAAPGQTVAA